MKKICLFGLVIFFFFSSRSQIEVTNQDSRYIFSLSPTANNRALSAGRVGTYQQASNRDTSSAFVFEFGDGYFTTNINSEHRYKHGGDMTTVLSLSGRYDTIKPPRHHSKLINVLPDPDPYYEPSTDPSYQQLLSRPGIMITPIASDLNARDEMLFIITYRLDTGATGKLYFFYNHSGFEMMEPVQLGSTISAGETFSRIRTHFQETSFTPSAGQLWPILNHSGMQRTDYKNMLAWNVNTRAGITERNIFISLKTKDTLELATGYFEAVLSYTAGNEQKRMIASLPMESSARPHDPNYISMIPDCIKMDGRTKPVNFHIHFRNEGMGPAYRIWVDATIGKALLPGIRKNSLKVIIGGREVSPLNYKYTILTPDSFRIHIMLPWTDQGNATIGRTLEGNNISNWQVNPLTMGDIYFTVDVPATYEADFAATASITLFDHRDNDMPPEITEARLLRIRKDCNKNLLAPIIIPQDCTCNMFLALCWWWWVIIGLIALLILLLLFIRTRRRNIDRR